MPWKNDMWKVLLYEAGGMDGWKVLFYKVGCMDGSFNIFLHCLYVKEHCTICSLFPEVRWLAYLS